MANAGFRMGWEWIFVGDHSQSVHVANGLSPKDLHRSIEETRQVNNKIKNIRVFRSMEVDILKNGALDYNDDDLGAIDAVVAGIHSNMNMSEQEMTERIVKAVQNRHVDILAHPSGRLINKRDVYQVNIEAILEACQKNKTAVEINGQPDRLDLFDFHAKRAKELGIPLVLTTDAHAAGQLAFMELAVITARRAWLEKGDVLNSLSAKELAEWLEIKI
ncbi:MAG: PHP domain-containing protein [Elusimicrobia bacterium]|nr:PHP domain-containing protein [Elusimicrobiota bacterium]